jgi:predicted deacylase
MLRPDVINMDPGIDGAVENMLNAVSVPAVTYELGGAEVFDSTLIARGLRGVRNVMIDRGMIAGIPDLSDPEPYLGNQVTNVESPRGGWSHVKVKLNQNVRKGDVLATITDPFGQIIATLTAPFDAHILGMGTDPRTQPGDMVVRLIDWSDKGVCAQTGCPETAPMVKSK